jgi:GTP-binding protein
LFNRLVGRQAALVDPRPGVTRDRHERVITLGDFSFRLLDTAGIEALPAHKPQSLNQQMQAQTQEAISEADLILFMVDIRAPNLLADRDVIKRIRTSGKPVIFLGNKAESRIDPTHLSDAFRLGFGEPLLISSAHGVGIDSLRTTLLTRLKSLGYDSEHNEEQDDAQRPLRLAVIGRPNTGKSTLINSMVGENRLVTSPESGTTRDTITLNWSWNGQPMELKDTAGLRRKAQISDPLEQGAVSSTLQTIRDVDVIIALMDATIPFERQDLRIIRVAESEGRAIIIGLNKWDLVQDKAKTLKHMEEECLALFPDLQGIPLIPVSALKNHGIDRLMSQVSHARETWNRHIPTGSLNSWLKEALIRHPPPLVGGKAIKIRYITQPRSRPPSFALFGNRLSLMPDTYKRYLLNHLRTHFNLPGTPIRFMMRTGSNPYT